MIETCIYENVVYAGIALMPFAVIGHSELVGKYNAVSG